MITVLEIVRLKKLRKKTLKHLNMVELKTLCTFQCKIRSLGLTRVAEYKVIICKGHVHSNQKNVFVFDYI